MTAQPKSGNVLLPSPGMEESAKNILWLVNAHMSNDALPFETSPLKLTHFPNGEYEPRLLETVRGAHVFLLHPMQLPDPNACLVNLHLIKDALVGAAVGKITLVLPYISFMRQDRRKDNARVSISARAVAKLVQTHVSQIITLDLHADQEVGFFDIPVNNMPGATLFESDLRNRYDSDVSNVIAVSPDIGSVVRTRRIANRLRVPLAIVDKDRKGPGDSRVMGIMGESVEGKDAVLFDDLIDTGGTILNAARAVLEAGAKSAEIYATHGLFCGDAVKKFASSGIPVRVTPSIPRSAEFLAEHASWLSYVSADQYLAEAIYQSTVMRGSITQLAS